jgi:hypothetical protein
LKREEADYINYRALLKSNYRKGERVMEQIVLSDELAVPFANNPAAVAVVCAFDPNNPDRNAEKLYWYLCQSDVADQAAKTCISQYVDFDGWDDLATKIDQITEKLTPMMACAASLSAVDAICSNETALSAVVHSSTSMACFGANADALSKIISTIKTDDDLYADYLINVWNDDSLLASYKADDDKWDEFTNPNDVVEAKVLCSLANISGSYSSTSALASNSSAVSSICANEKATESMIYSRNAISSFAGSTEAFEKMTSSDAAMNYIATNESVFLKMVSASANVTKFMSLANIWSLLSKCRTFIAKNASACAAFVGTSVSVTLTTYAAHNFIVVGVGQDTYASGGNVALSFQSEKIITTQAMNSSNDTTGGWGSSAMRTFLSGTLLGCFPSEVKNLISDVTKKYCSSTTYSSVSSCTDKLFIPSHSEIFGETTYGAEGDQYTWYKNGNSKIKYNGSSAYTWWLRSVGSSAYFRCVGSGGNASGGSATGTGGVAPCFCI